MGDESWRIFHTLVIRFDPISGTTLNWVQTTECKKSYVVFVSKTDRNSAICKTLLGVLIPISLLFIFITFRPSFLIYQDFIEDPETAKKTVSNLKLWLEDVDFSLSEKNKYGAPYSIVEVYSAHIEGNAMTGILRMMQPIYDSGYYKVDLLMFSKEKVNIYGCLMLWVRIKQLEKEFMQYLDDLKAGKIQSSDILMLMLLDGADERLTDLRD